MRRLDDLEESLNSRIRGQQHVLGFVAKAVQRAEMGLSKPTRPKASFLFLGPTGVGKTETCLELAVRLYGDTDHLARFNMAEYQGPADVGRLIGRSSSEQGFLGDAVDRLSADGGILLFDEIEKAHQDVALLFLAILDAAQATMENGSIKDFSPFYLVFTSNLGSADAIRMQNLPYTSLRRHVLNAASSYFRPELLARFQEKLVFDKLSYDIQVEIAEGMLTSEIAHIRSRTGISMAYDDKALQRLIRLGFDKFLGARPLRDTIEKQVGDLVTAYVRKGGRMGDNVSLTANDKQLMLEKDAERVDIFAEDIFAEDK